MQVEGGNTNNDWYTWELRGLTKDRAGVADDDYNRYPEDLDLAKNLNHNTYRMSLEWSRIEPTQGVFSAEALAHYRDVLTQARKRGLKTFVTIHHFTNPIWAANQGSWENEAMVHWYADYVRYVVPNLGDLVDYWLTINEPNVTALTGYVVGVTPPGKQDVKAAAQVIANFLKAHAAAYHIIHDFYPDAKVGFAHHMRAFDAASWWNPLDQLVAGFVHDFWNNQILRSIKTGHIHLSIPFVVTHDEVWPELEGALDFVGVNYYTRDLMRFNLNTPEKFEIIPNPGAPKSDVEWEIYPHGLYRSVMTAASFGWPIYITENGIADSRDVKRKKFICDHLRELADAMEDGADVRGYLHWALLDNWEWVDGFGPRFGLVQVDYATQARTIRPSGRAFGEIIRSNSLAACK